MSKVHFFMQHDPEGKKNRHLYYHFVDEHKPDKLIAKIRKEDDDIMSFKVSNDYKTLILVDSHALSTANIESLDEEITFKRIFKINENISYVSKMIWYWISCVLSSYNINYATGLCRKLRRLLFIYEKYRSTKT